VPDEILYLIGSFIIGLLFFSMAYKLIMSSIKQSQNEVVLKDFENLYNEMNSVCSLTGNYGLALNYEIPASVRVIYATEDPKDFEIASAFVDTNLYSIGNNICIVFKDETQPRCKRLECDVAMPYIGSLDYQDDFQLFVNKILGRKLVKRYSLYIQNYAGIVVVTKDRYIDLTQLNLDIDFNDYIILAIQLNDEIEDFQQKAEELANKWKEMTPLKDCTAEVKVLKLSTICNVPDQQGICNGDVSAYYQTFYNIMDCISKSNYFGFYDRVVGFVKGDRVCELSGARVEGYAFGYAMPVIVASQGNYLDIAIHELGHTYGLCDEGYGSGQDSRCESGYSMSGGDSCDPGDVCCPNHPEQNSIYCTWDKCHRRCSYAFNFAPSSYDHLKKELKKYCG
jgi:hypothetical protein